MRRIDLVSLRISGFRSFLEETEINFTQKGLYSIQGLDTRSGGSNGAGKSSIFEAIYWILGLNKLPATDLKNYNSTQMSGTLELTSSGKKIKINRTSSKLELEIDNLPILGLKADIERKLFEELGDPEIFELLSYRRQEDRGLFFYSTDSELKKFLTRCIPEIDKLETIATAAQKVADDLKKNLDNDSLISKTLNEEFNLTNDNSLDIVGISTSIHSLINERDSISFKDFITKEQENRLNEINRISNSLKQDIISADEGNLSLDEMSAINELEQKKIELDTYRNQISPNGELSGIQSIFKSQKDAISKTIDEIRRKENEKNTLSVKAKDLYRKYEEISEQIKHYKDNKCSTCLRTWDESQNKLATALVKSLEIKDEIVNISNIIKSFPEEMPIDMHKKQLDMLSIQESELISKLRMVDLQLQSIDSEKKQISANPKNRKKQKVTELEIKTLVLANESKSIQDNVESLVNNKINKIRSDIQVLTMTLEHHKQYQVKRLTLLDKIKSLIIKSQETESAMILESTISKVLGRKGVLGLIMDGILKETEHETNRLLSEIPNTSDISINICTTTETKSGSIRNEITTKIFKNGTEISFKSLSGGQKSSLSLCADLSLVTSIRQRTNINSGWIALDESMDGMDNFSKESALGLIKNIMPDNLILMIEHSTEIKEFFDGSIKVIFDGKTSRVEK